MLNRIRTLTHSVSDVSSITPIGKLRRRDDFDRRQPTSRQATTRTAPSVVVTRCATAFVSLSVVIKVSFCRCTENRASVLTQGQLLVSQVGRLTILIRSTSIKRKADHVCALHAPTVPGLARIFNYGWQLTHVLAARRAIRLCARCTSCGIKEVWIRVAVRHP